MSEKVLQNINPKITEACGAAVYKYAQVCLPVSVEPFADVKEIKTKCLGSAVIVSGGTKCSGTKNGTCDFTITQKLLVEIPVVFGAKVAYCDAYVDCLKSCPKEMENDDQK